MAGAAVLLCACGSSTSLAPTHGNVFVIVMENHSSDEALTGSFTASLAAAHGVAENYHAVAHPSVPDYLALTSGQTWGVRDDSFHVLPREDLGDQLTSAGVPWHAYMEGLGPAGCLASPEPYDPGHNPFAFYGGQCPPAVVPFERLADDLASGGPRFSWIGPDSCHDEHNCSVAVGDAWLRQTITEIMSSAAWKPGSALFVTWDEDDGSAGNRVLTIVVRPGDHHRVSQVAFDHYSLLASVEDLLGVPRLANAARATTMSDLLG